MPGKYVISISYERHLRGPKLTVATVSRRYGVEVRELTVHPLAADAMYLKFRYGYCGGYLHVPLGHDIGWLWLSDTERRMASCPANE